MTVLNRKLITRIVNPQPGGNGGGGGYVPQSQDVSWTDINGKPTTLSGYGITDAYWATTQSTSDKRNLTIGSVTQQVITAHQSLSGYATEYWVGQQGYITSSGSCAYATSAGNADTAGTANYANNGNIPFMLNGATDNLPSICWHISNTNWCNIAMDSEGNLHLTSTNVKSSTYNGLYVGALRTYGTLTIATGAGIQDATGAGMLCYHPADWTAVSNTQWGVGAIDCEGVIRSSNNALKHYRDNDGTYEIIDSKGGQTIANSLQIASVKIEQTNEVNSYQGALYLNYRVASDVTACIGGGNFGIGTTSPGYKLHVAGKIYCTGGFAFLSDIRKKNVVGFCNGFSVKDIANAPLIQYTLKGDLDDGRRHIGSVAQYWQKVLPDTVNEADDTLSMDQESILMASVITLARKVMSLENQIIQLKMKGYGKQ